MHGLHCLSGKTPIRVSILHETSQIMSESTAVSSGHGGKLFGLRLGLDATGPRPKLLPSQPNTNKQAPIVGVALSAHISNSLFSLSTMSLKIPPKMKRSNSDSTEVYLLSSSSLWALLDRERCRICG